MEIIRRYDEVIAEKASKHSVYMSETRINEQYKPVIQDLDDRIENNLSLIKEQREHFNEFKEILTAEVFTAVKKATIKEIKLYESQQAKSQPHIMGLSTILNEGQGGLLKVLSGKADQDDVEKLYELKTNK